MSDKNDPHSHIWSDDEKDQRIADLVAKNIQANLDLIRLGKVIAKMEHAEAMNEEVIAEQEAQLAEANAKCDRFNDRFDEVRQSLHTAHGDVTDLNAQLAEALTHLRNLLEPHQVMMTHRSGARRFLAQMEKNDE